MTSVISSSLQLYVKVLTFLILLHSFLLQKGSRLRDYLSDNFRKFGSVPKILLPPVFVYFFCKKHLLKDESNLDQYWSTEKLVSKRNLTRVQLVLIGKRKAQWFWWNQWLFIMWSKKFSQMCKNSEVVAPPSATSEAAETFCSWFFTSYLQRGPLYSYSVHLRYALIAPSSLNLLYKLIRCI